MLLVFRYALAAFRGAARERRELALENVALRHQLEVLSRSQRRPQLRPGDRLLWSWLSRVWPAWRHHVWEGVHRSLITRATRSRDW